MSGVARTRRIGYVPFFDERAEKGYTFAMRDALADFGDVVRCDGVVATWRSSSADGSTCSC